ncbi:universal stress protein [Halobellus sp. Atlit-31R]|nr:universal stress protein [Halobellus sp. Atlit-31R]
MALRVVVPYDGAEHSRFAIDCAFERFAPEEITILHVIEPFPDHSKAAGHRGHRYARVFQQKQQFLAEAVAAGHDSDRRISTELIYGRPVVEVPRYVESNGADEVIMGSRGLDGLSNVLLGSVSQAVVRRTPVPATIVRTPGETETGDRTEPRSILVLFDGSARSRSALTYACEEFQNAAITVLFVSGRAATEHESIESATDLDEAVARGSTGDDDESERVRSASRRIAERYGHEVTPVFAVGDAANEVLRWADDHEVDHIVVGRRGRGGLKGLLSGSVAEIIARRAPVSVTVVP